MGDAPWCIPAITIRIYAMKRTIMLSLLLLIAGCDAGSSDETLNTTQVIVGNSGLFSGGGTSLTLYDPATRTARQEDLSVGFINSLALREDQLYVVDNAADGATGRITIFSTDRLEAAGQIQNNRPPRQIAFVDNDKAYATNLSTFDANFNPMPGTVSVIDLNTNRVTGSIPVGLVPEGIVVAAGKAFVANAGSGGQSTTLTIIDTATDTALRTLDVGCDGPDELFVDDEGEVVIVCAGRAAFTGASSNGQVVFLDPDTETVTARLPLDVGVGSANGTQTAFYSSKDEVLFVLSSSNDLVLRVATDSNTLDGQFAIPTAADLIGMTAVAYDATLDRLYIARLPVGDAPGVPDFTAAGAVVVLDDAGVQVDRFTAGISPAHIVLR